ncbi:MAG: hypothetical protein IT532_04045 [Burkholderiales bacterium]|nr:hypothetical protein [Burkholderiales bacterium]
MRMSEQLVYPNHVDAQATEDIGVAINALAESVNDKLTQLEKKLDPGLVVE